MWSLAFTTFFAKIPCGVILHFFFVVVFLPVAVVMESVVASERD